MSNLKINKAKLISAYWGKQSQPSIGEVCGAGLVYDDICQQHSTMTAVREESLIVAQDVLNDGGGEIQVCSS